MVDDIHNEPINKPTDGFSGFTSGTIEDAEEDFGGLMVGASAQYSCFLSHTVIVCHKGNQDQKR